MNLQRIACDILNVGDIALTRKQTGYPESVIKQRPSIEQQTLENAAYLDYKKDNMYEYAIQKLREDETLVAILSLSIINYGDLLDLMMDFVTGDYENAEYTIEAEIEATKEEMVDEDPLENTAPDNDTEATRGEITCKRNCNLPDMARNFLSTLICHGKPTYDFDSSYADKDGRPVSHTYIELLGTYGATIDTAVWLDETVYQFASKLNRIPNSDAVYNNDLLRTIIIAEQQPHHNQSEDEKGIIKYLKFWLGENYDAAVDYIKDMFHIG